METIQRTKSSPKASTSLSPNKPPVVPPADADCEEMVLASLLLHERLIPKITEILSEECFSDPERAAIFAAVMSLFNASTPVDLISVMNETARRGQKVGMVRLTQLLSAPTCLDDGITYYAGILRDLSTRRKILSFSLRAQSMATDSAVPALEIHSRLLDDLRRAIEEQNDNSCETLNDVYRRLQAQMLINRNRPEGECSGTPTGFRQLDEAGGLHGSDLIVVGAETSVGKTSFATALALSAICNREGVAFYSMEMQPEQLNARIASMLTGISSSQIQYGQMDIGRIYQIDEAMESIEGSRLFFDGRSTSTLETICASIRTMKYRHNISGAVIDYLQLVNVAASRGQNKEQETAKVARDLKNLAKELNIWIVALSQFSRGDRTGVPSLNRLRDSGQIEEAVDIAILLHRPKDGRPYPAPFSDVPTEGTCLVDIAKGRNIGVQKFICGFDASSTRFHSLTPEEIDHIRVKAAPGDRDSLQSAAGSSTSIDTFF